MFAAPSKKPTRKPDGTGPGISSSSSSTISDGSSSDSSGGPPPIPGDGGPGSGSKPSDGGGDNPSKSDSQSSNAPDGSHPPAPRPVPDKINRDVMYYRGSRVIVQNNCFVVENVKAKRQDSGFVVLEITFNQNINPRSLNDSSILVNGQEVSPEIKFSFNRKGDTIKLELPCDKDVLKVKIQNLRSFGGTILAPVELTKKIL
ncbi:MAG: hypothetical protein K5681_01235 [Treponema sp.]|nr:hypothetical protein [Treponema sp.]